MPTAEPGCTAWGPLFAYLESKLNCVLQKLSRKICDRYGRHHLNDEKHPYAFRTGKGGNSGLSRSVTYGAGHDSGAPAADRPASYFSAADTYWRLARPFHSAAAAGRSPSFSSRRDCNARIVC